MPIAEGIRMFTLLLVEENWLSDRNSTYSIPIADHRLFSGKNSAHIFLEFGVHPIFLTRNVKEQQSTSSACNISTFLLEKAVEHRIHQECEQNSDRKGSCNKIPAKENEYLTDWLNGF